MHLVWAQGNFGIGTTTPTERLDVEGGRLRVRAYSGPGTRLATVDPNGVFGTLAGNAAGEVLQWNGTAWVPTTISVPGDNWGTQTAVTSGPIQGNGTAGSPITFQPGTAAGQTWVWNGTNWILGTAPGDNWGTQTAATQGPIQGDGTNANPITFQPGTAAGQTWVWNGTNWILGTPAGDDWGTQTAATQGPIQGDGTNANPITFQPGTAAGQTWIWNGTNWTLGIPAGDDWGTQTAATQGPIQGDGTTNNPITLQPGNAPGQILVWTGTAWSTTTPAVRNGLSFVVAPTPAIELGGNLIKNTDIDLNGFNLTLSGTGDVGIGTATPTERLHVDGNLRLQGAFMPNNQPGANGNLLLSAGAGTPPVWLANGNNGQVLTIVGGVPQWANNNAICGSPTLNRLPKFSSTSPAQVCNTTLAENASNQIWNPGDGPAAPFAGDKFSIYATGDNPYAISGYTNQLRGTALWGEASGSGSIAVLGQASGSAFVGTVGRGPTTGAGVAGMVSSNFFQQNAAGSFYNEAANGIGVIGFVNQAGGTAVAGIAGGPNTRYAAAGSFVTQGAQATALIGDCASCAGGFGVVGLATGGAAVGVEGRATGGSAVGVSGFATGGGTVGVRGEANGASAVGVLGVQGQGGGAIAIYALGDIDAFGTKLFHIDHPLDPENKYLLHFSAEGPEPYNLYRGVVVTDAEGRAVIQLPAYFEAINKDFSYYLQPIGTFTQVIVEEEVQNNRFVIRTEKPHVKVSWMLLARRNDLYVQKYGRPTEMDKPAEHRGKYLMPQLYGKDDSFAIYPRPSAKAPEAQPVQTLSVEKSLKK